MINADSIKARLKNQAKEDGKTMQEELTTYGLERTIYRISVSKYADRFTLKGGILMYALFDGDFARATTDIDLLAQNISADIDEMKKVFEDIFSQTHDDALRYDINTLNVHTITEFKEYHGVNISIKAYLDKTKVPISIDIGFGDVVYPIGMVKYSSSIISNGLVITMLIGGIMSRRKQVLPLVKEIRER